MNVCSRSRDADLLTGLSPHFFSNATAISSRLQESGVAVPSSTILDGKFAIRVAITNHRSRREDFDALVAAVIQTGKEVTAAQVPS
jgi:hypothetical protein